MVKSTFEMTQVLFPAHTSGSSQLLIIPAPGNLTPHPHTSLDLRRHTVHTYVSTHTDIYDNKNKIILANKKGYEVERETGGGTKGSWQRF